MKFEQILGLCIIRPETRGAEEIPTPIPAVVDFCYKKHSITDLLDLQNGTYINKFLSNLFTMIFNIFRWKNLPCHLLHKVLKLHNSPIFITKIVTTRKDSLYEAGQGKHPHIFMCVFFLGIRRSVMLVHFSRQCGDGSRRDFFVSGLPSPIAVKESFTEPPRAAF